MILIMKKKKILKYIPVINFQKAKQNEYNISKYLDEQGNIQVEDISLQDK